VPAAAVATTPAATAGQGERPARSDREDDGSVVDALDDLGAPAAYSTEGWRRLSALRDELRLLRARLDQPLPDLLSDIERTIGLDVEVAVRRPGEQALARGHLDAFLDVAADFTADLGVASGGSLTGFLGYLSAAEEQERGLEAGVVERRADAVQILTVHGAKGLEWDVVAIPGLVKDVFPSKDAGRDVWTTKLGAVPYPLRGDRADLPQWIPAACADQKDADLSRAAFLADCAAIGLLEERRLAYVAITRARSELLCSGYWWDDTALASRGPSVLLDEVHEYGGGAAEHWQPPPEKGVSNPRRAEVRTASWPFDPLGSRREAVDDAAARVRAARPDDPSPSEWHQDVALLLAERAAGVPDVVDVALPVHLSVSQLITLRRDPQRLAAQLRRPMPFAPAPLARRGTAFHAWLEHRFGAERLLDLDELPGAEDAGADDSDLAALQEAFLGSDWADRTPIEVEVPFEFRLGALSLRGRMDAVFADVGGGFVVVDWKTGQPPAGADASATAVQLAAYRLAWAELSGVPPERVGAAFHYVRQNRTVRPADLLDGAGLLALIETLPTPG
ncbi:MAG: PD-(D/E)XK nuclease family protein, partial [Geodermatophilaceae bacterium]|nr:PD-(D/E)XK nuclease family protein [Geodermatophilaceae bacterium]